MDRARAFARGYAVVAAGLMATGLGLGVATIILAAKDAGFDPTVILQAFQDITGHKWMPLAILVIGYLTSLTNDTSKLPFNIPSRYQPVLVIVLGQAYAALQAVSSGAAVWPTVEHGLVTSFVTMGLFDLIVRAVFNGNLPSWLRWLGVVDPKLVDAKRAGMLPPQPLLGRKNPPAFVPAAAPSAPPSSAN